MITEFAWALAVLCAVLGAFSVWKTRDWINPIFILGLVITIFYFGKALIVDQERQLIFSYHYFSTYGEGTVELALLSVGIAFAIISSVVLAGSRPIADRAPPVDKEAIGLNAALLVAFFVSFLTVAFTFGDIAKDAIGEVVANRFDFFRGRGYLLPLIGFYKAAVFIWLAYRSRSAGWSRILLIYAPTVFFDLLTGSRGKFVIENLLVVAIILARTGKLTITLPKLIGGVAAAIAVTLGLRIALRDAVLVINANLSIGELLLGSFWTELVSVYYGPEAGLLDGVAFVIDKALGSLGGITLIAPVFYPIPRALFDQKPSGASATLTESFFPAYYYPDNIELAFPLVAEILANFSVLGLLGFVFVGLLIRWAYRASFAHDGIKCVIAVVVLTRSVLLFRNDFFNFAVGVSNIVVAILILYGVALIAKSPSGVPRDDIERERQTPLDPIFRGQEARRIFDGTGR